MKPTSFASWLIAVPLWAVFISGLIWVTLEARDFKIVLPPDETSSARIIIQRTNHLIPER